MRVRTHRNMMAAITVALLAWVATGHAMAQTATASPDAPSDVAGENAANDDTAKAANANFVPAIEFLPDDLAGLVRVPNLPKVCDAASQTLLGQMLADPVMQPFLDSQRERARERLQSLGNRVGLKPDDLFDIASGEVVFAWLPFQNDRRRPYALCVVADVRDRAAEVASAMKQIDVDLLAGGWKRTDRDHLGQTVRVYDQKPKPGQLKIEQIAIAATPDRVIAADRDSVVTDLLAAIAKGGSAAPIADSEDFRTVLTRSARQMKRPFESGGGQIAAEWFARPFAMGRILRDAIQIDRGDDVDVLRLLEGQGFDAIRAAGGIVLVAGETYDILHRGYVLAPPTAPLPEKYSEAARMLRFPNAELRDIPAWVPQATAAYHRLQFDIENAFWASKSLVNEAVDDDIFDDIVEGIKEDRDGPQIDLKNNVLPNLDNEIHVLLDNTLPTELDSQRLLVAIKVRDATKIATAMKKMMEAEPDASLLDDVPGVPIYQVMRTEDELDDLEADLFDDFDDPAAEEDAPPPLLNQWTVATVSPGAGSPDPLLVISSHKELLIEVIRRVRDGGQGLGTEPQIVQLHEAAKDLGLTELALERLVRTRLTLRAKYELLRQGKLKDSDSIASNIFRRLTADEDVDVASLDAAKLPPLAAIEKYLPPGASMAQTTDDGWELIGFFLNQEVQ